MGLHDQELQDIIQQFNMKSLCVFGATLTLCYIENLCNFLFTWAKSCLKVPTGFMLSASTLLRQRYCKTGCVTKPRVQSPEFRVYRVLNVYSSDSNFKTQVLKLQTLNSNSDFKLEVQSPCKTGHFSELIRISRAVNFLFVTTVPDFYLRSFFCLLPPDYLGTFQLDQTHMESMVYCGTLMKNSSAGMSCNTYSIERRVKVLLGQIPLEVSLPLVWAHSS